METTLAVPTRTFSITLELPLTCPQCSDAVGFLFPESGVCLGCELDNQERDQYEATEADRYWAEAEQSCCTCGID